MASVKIDKIRNAALLSHSGAGKTSLAEALLFNTKAINRMGKVESGNTVSDYEAEEVKRASSVQASIIPCLTKGHKINFLDTPGYDDFRGEVVSSLRVVEGAVILVSAIAGVEVGTETSWNTCQERDLPRIIFINKMDRDNAEFQRTLDSIQAAFGRECVPLNVPIGAAQDFKGVVDLLDAKAEAPEGMEDFVEAARERLVESVAESDDDLATKYLEGEELTTEEMTEGLKKAVLAGEIVPVLCGSATENMGVEELQQAVIDYVPSPDSAEVVGREPETEETREIAQTPDAPLVALVFKTTADPFVGKLSLFRVYGGVMKGSTEVWDANQEQSERIGQIYTMCGKDQEATAEVGPGDIGAVAKLAAATTNDTLCDREIPVLLEPIVYPEGHYAMAVSPKSKADLDKMSSSLTRIVEEDPSLKLSREPSTNETLLTGAGDVHLDTTVDRIKRKFGTELVLQLPKVPYRETITVVSRAEYKHKKQTGGHGQYGHVLLRLEPGDRDSGFEFDSEITGGAVPREYISSVEKGVVKAMSAGALAGFPVVDVRAVLYDGSYHDVDSSGISFEIAGSYAFRQGMTDGNPMLLEPIMKLAISVPDTFTGDVIGDLNGRRGRVVGMIPESGGTIIEAEAPRAEVLRYSTDLRSLTQGRASFTMEFSHYEGVPPVIGQRVIQESQREEAQA